MSFRGIDPEGLSRLADALDERVTVIDPRPVAALLGSRDRAGDHAPISAELNRTGRWLAATSADLRWRAAAIVAGRQSGWDPPMRLAAMVRAGFAMTAIVPPGGARGAFESWLRDLAGARRERDRRVAAAIASVSSRLSQSWRDWDVSNADLEGIRRTLAGLDGSDLDRVIAGLSDRRLRRWIAEMGHSVNGFSRREKQRLFADIASKASGATLARLYATIVADRPGSLDAADFGSAVAAEAADDVIVSFVVDVVEAGLGQTRFGWIGPVMAVPGVDRPENIDRLISRFFLDGAAIGRLVGDMRLTAWRGGVDPTGEFFAALGRGEDPVLRAGVFAVVARIASNPGAGLDDGLGGWPGGGSRSDVGPAYPADADELLDALTALIATDPVATVEALSRSVDVDGTATIGWIDGLIDRGRIGDFMPIFNTLRGGTEPDVEWLAEPGTDAGYRFPNAASLGFASGALSRALELQVVEATDRIELIAFLATVTETVVGFQFEGARMLRAAGGAGLGLGIGAVADGEVEDVEAQLRRVRSRLHDAIVPSEGDVAWDANALLVLYRRLGEISPDFPISG